MYTAAAVRKLYIEKQNLQLRRYSAVKQTNKATSANPSDRKSVKESQENCKHTQRHFTTSKMTSLRVFVIQSH